MKISGRQRPSRKQGSPYLRHHLQTPLDAVAVVRVPDRWSHLRHAQEEGMRNELNREVPGAGGKGSRNKQRKQTRDCRGTHARRAAQGKTVSVREEKAEKKKAYRDGVARQPRYSLDHHAPALERRPREHYLPVLQRLASAANLRRQTTTTLNVVHREASWQPPANERHQHNRGRQTSRDLRARSGLDRPYKQATESKREQTGVNTHWQTETGWHGMPTRSKTKTHGNREEVEGGSNFMRTEKRQDGDAAPANPRKYSGSKSKGGQRELCVCI